MIMNAERCGPKLNRLTAGVKYYRLTYYMKDYRVHLNDLLAAFRVIAQPGVPAEEAGAAHRG